MNLLEHYITKIGNIRRMHEYDNEAWAKDKEFLEVELWYKCYSDIEQYTKQMFSKEEWLEVKEKGYWLG